MEVSFYLKHPDADCETAIFARVYYPGMTRKAGRSIPVKYYLPEKITPKFWNKATHRAKETHKFREYPEFNRRLDVLEAAIKNTIRKYANDNGNQYPAPSELKSLLDICIKHTDEAGRLTFMQFFDSFIERSKNGERLNEKGKPITPGTVKTYATTKTCIVNFQAHTKRKVDFENIDMQFYNDFTKYLSLTAKQSTNYIGKHIKVIKTVLTDAKTNFKIKVNEDFKASGFKTITEKADNIYLPEYELRKIAELDLSGNPRLDRVRDLFLVGCYTGLRFSDLASVTPEQISGGMISLTQIKTGDAVVIPVHDAVREVLAKYGGRLPKAISNQKTNGALKEIGQMCEALKKKVSISFTKGGALQTDVFEKWELVTTHTARRSFATNQYLNGVPTLSIMAITGHKTEAAFMKYIKVAPTEHAKILKEIWDGNKEAAVKRIAV